MWVTDLFKDCLDFINGTQIFVTKLGHDSYYGVH
jgi:hypothetical protein